MTVGDKWRAAIPRNLWPDALVEEMQQDVLKAKVDPTGHYTWDSEYGDRRSEIVCIGKEVDKEAAMAQLEACLLTPEEMATSKASWLDLPDPFAKMLKAQESHEHSHGSDHAGQHEHDHDDDERLERLAYDLMSGSAEANVRATMALTKEHGVHPDDRISIAMEAFDERIVVQIQECAPALHSIFDTFFVDKLRTQSAILKGVSHLVTGRKHGEALLNQTPDILKALYDTDLVSKDALLFWHDTDDDDDSADDRKVAPEREAAARAAATPFIKWLQGAEEQSLPAESSRGVVHAS